MEILGSSKIQYYEDAMKKLITELLQGNHENLTIKLDSRANVKGSYGKFIPAANQKPAEIRIYTGALITTWDVSFSVNEGIDSDTEALLFVTAYLLKKYLRGVAFEVKTPELDPDKNAPLKVDPDYVDILSKFEGIKVYYTQLIASSPALNQLGTKKASGNLTEDVLTETVKVSQAEAARAEHTPEPIPDDMPDNLNDVLEGQE